MKLIKFVLLIVFAAATLGISNVFAGSGDLDPTFGPVGFLTTPFDNEDAEANEILRQPDGKIILVGKRSGGPTPGGITLVRYNADGTFDTTFDADGFVLADVGEANAAVLQSDGKILVVGKYVEDSSLNFAVLRFNTDGSLDTTFSGDGIFTGSNLFTGNVIAVQSDGKIVASGTLITGPSNDFSTIRLNADGTPNTTFGTNGQVTTPVGDPSVNSGDDVVKDVAIQADGKIVVAGFSPFANTSRDFSLVRYNTNGTLDTSFDSDGILRTAFNNLMQEDTLEAIALDAMGSIVAVGHTSTGVGEESFALARYNSDGSLDASFSDDGKLLIKTRPNTIEMANDFVIQPDGKILIAGMSGYNAQDFVLVRFNSNGTLDASFGINSVVYSRVSEDLDAAFRSVTLAPNGDIFAGGFAENSTRRNSFAFAKYNADGVPAPEFGVFGYITYNFSNDQQFSNDASSVALQPDGKFIVAGNSLVNTGASNGFVARFDPNGSLDRNFNNQSGYALITTPASGPGTREVTSVTVQSDGKILVLGNYEGETDAGIFISRFNSDGSRDTIFGNNGQVVLSVFNGGGLGQDILVLSDGKILVAGATANIISQTIKPAIFKFNTNGSHDTSFGSNGIATTSFSSSNDIALALDVQADGKIIIAGASNFDLGGTNGSIAIARFNSNGVIDNTFGSGGKVTTNVGTFIDTAADVKIQADGKIVIGGVTCTDGNCDGGLGLLFRYNSNGSLDTSFDGDGKIILQSTPPGMATAIGAIALQSDGKIVASGVTTTAATQSDTLIARFNSDGSFDTGFGTNGIATSDIGGTDQLAFDVALQSDGKILAVGSNQVGSRADFAVWRFLGDGEAVSNNKAMFDFDGDNRTDISIFRSGPGQWWYLRSSDNDSRAFQFGQSTDKLVPADFTGDGKTDIAFWRPSTGQWFVLRSEDNSFFAFDFGTNGDIPIPADFDGDGKADPAIFRPSNSTWFILNSGGGTTIQQFGLNGDAPIPNDFDSDGKADLAVYRPSESQWFYQRSTDLVVKGFQFGSNGDKAVPADFTGDGKADIAFWRPSSGEWFILRSEDNSFFAFPFGTNGDIPTPGDYDGDGTADAAVFRPSNNVWFLQQSTNGFTAVAFGVSGDIPLPNVFVP